MDIDPNLIAVAGIALWLGGAFALTGIVRDWSDDRRARGDRPYGGAEAGDTTG